MRDVSCELITTRLSADEKGIQKQTELKKVPIPIIRVEDVYSNEFYKANEKGYKPSLRLIISPLNYNNEEELIYMGITYSIIRTQEVEADELALICERKVKNVK